MARGRWVALVAPDINCRSQGKDPCGMPAYCIYCASQANAALYADINGKQMAVAAAISLRRAKWKNTSALSYLILSLMEAAKKLRYDKMISYYGGITVPVEEFYRIFKDGQGKQHYAQRRRNEDGVSEYSVVDDASNKHYVGWLYRLAQVEEALPKFTGVLGMNMERWADAVEVFLGTLELAERTKELRKVIPFSIFKLRVVVETSIRGFTDSETLPLSRNKRSVTKQILPDLPVGCSSWNDVIDWDDDIEYSNIAVLSQLLLDMLSSCGRDVGHGQVRRVASQLQTTATHR